MTDGKTIGPAAGVPEKNWRDLTVNFVFLSPYIFLHPFYSGSSSLSPSPSLPRQIFVQVSPSLVRHHRLWRDLDFYRFLACSSSFMFSSTVSLVSESNPLILSFFHRFFAPFFLYYSLRCSSIGIQRGRSRVLSFYIILSEFDWLLSLTVVLSFPTIHNFGDDRIGGIRERSFNCVFFGVETGEAGRQIGRLQTLRRPKVLDLLKEDQSDQSTWQSLFAAGCPWIKDGLLLKNKLKRMSLDGGFLVEVVELVGGKLVVKRWRKMGSIPIKMRWGYIVFAKLIGEDFHSILEDLKRGILNWCSGKLPEENFNSKMLLPPFLV